MVSLMPDVACNTRNQSHSGWKSIADVIPDGEVGRWPGEPIRDPSQSRAPLQHGSRLAPGGTPGSAGMTAGTSRPLLRILLVHRLEEGRSLDAPLLLELDQLAVAVPFLQRRRHELAPRAVALLELHRQTPRLLHDGRQR